MKSGGRTRQVNTYHDSYPPSASSLILYRQHRQTSWSTSCRDIRPDRMAPPINYTLLIELIAIVIASSAFLFYFNRLGGWLLAFGIRWFVWPGSRVYVTCGSLQLSLLAGRVSFRDLEYHSSNISVRALHGHVTWRYWKFRTKQNEDVDSTNTLRSKWTPLAGSADGRLSAM